MSFNVNDLPAPSGSGVWGEGIALTLLPAEMLGQCVPEVTQAVRGKSYFDPQEMQQRLRRTGGSPALALGRVRGQPIRARPAQQSASRLPDRRQAATGAVALPLLPAVLAGTHQVVHYARAIAAGAV
jgi:hypothetical protein